jgi:hypothetical protein
VVPELTLRSAGQRHGEQQPAGIDIAECYFGQFAVCFNMLDICRFDASLTCLLGGSGPIHLDLFICSLGINLVLCR